jgi:hypothetical protein
MIFDPIEKPEVVELNTESAWAMFSDEPRPVFQDTLPLDSLDSLINVQ